MQNTRGTSSKTGTAGAEGVDFQLNIILYTLLQVDKLNLTDYEIYTELKCAGKFDDLVLKYKDHNNKERCCLLQAKHVIDETKTVSFNDLISSDKYNLQTYFNSYKDLIGEVQFKDRIEHLILFTNLDLNDKLLPHFEEIKLVVPIWDCQQVKRNNKKPKLYKLNTSFTDELQFYQLHILANVIIDYCVKGIQLKSTNNNFMDCHVLLAAEVFNVEKTSFRQEFIERHNLQSETRIFRDIIEEEIRARDNIGSPREWLENVTLTFSNDFGKSSYSKAKVANTWPIPIKDEDKELYGRFISHLILALNQPNDSEIENCLSIIFAQLFGKSMANMAKGELKYKIRQWFKDTRSTPLTSHFLNDAIKYINGHEEEVTTSNNSRVEIAELFQQGIDIEHLSITTDVELFMQTEKKRLLKVLTRRNTELSSIKIISCLQELNQNDYLFTSKRKLTDLIKVHEVFRKSNHYNILVWHQLALTITDVAIFKDLLNDLVNKIQHDITKKVIIIFDDRQNVFSKDNEIEESLIQCLNDETQFGDLASNTRIRLQRRIISFQGSDVEFDNIQSENFQLDHIEYETWGDLSNRNEIAVSQKINLTKDYNLEYYIKRTIILTRIRTDNSKEEQPFSEHNFIRYALTNELDSSTEEIMDKSLNNIRPRIFILSDHAGMGKTTVSSCLTDEIKKSYPYYWVTRLVAMECAADLSLFSETASPSDADYDNFLMAKLLKVSKPLDRFIFGQYLKETVSNNKLVIVFDGYDEIDAPCQHVITNLFKYLGLKRNVGFIVITTRPQFQQVLEEQFQIKACILRQFNASDKIEFLKRYWTSKGISANQIRLNEFAKQLIKNISYSILETESQLTGVPLQMKMIAEIYEKEARDFVQTDGKHYIENFYNIELFELYERFLRIKEQIYLKEKMEKTGSAGLSDLIKSVQNTQSKYAIETILRPSIDAAKVAAAELETTTYLGIIQKNQGGFYFIHRTFAEFLTAKYLLEEYIDNDSVSIIDKIREGLLIEQMGNSSLHVVRRFINSKMKTAQLIEQCKSTNENQKTLRELLCVNCVDIIVTAAEEEVYEILKFTLEINSWLEPNEMFDKLRTSLWSTFNNSKCLTAIIDCMIEKWQPSADVILIDTIEFLIRNILLVADDYGADRSELIKSVIRFQNELQSAGMFPEEKLRSFLLAMKVSLKRYWYWNWYAIDYFEYIHSTHRNLFYELMDGNRYLAHRILRDGIHGTSNNFLIMIQNDKEVDPNWVFNTFIKNEFNGFGEWKDKHFELYFSILHDSSGNYDSEKNEKFRNYLEGVIQLLYQRYDLTWAEIYSKFLMNYEDIIPLEYIHSKFDKTKTAKDLEYCAIWGQTRKLQCILEVGDIEENAVEMFKLEQSETEELVIIRRKILNSIRGRHGEDTKFLELVGQRNWCKKTILVHAIKQNVELNIEIISEWITSAVIFGKLLTLEYQTGSPAEFESFLNFVDERFPQYKMRFFEINKNMLISWASEYQEIFRIIEDDKNIDRKEFVKILKLQADHSAWEGCTILHVVLGLANIGILEKWLNLINKFSLDSETIALLFSIKNKYNCSQLDYIKRYSNYVRRQEKRKLLIEFFDKLNLKELKIELKNQMDSSKDSVNKKNQLRLSFSKFFHNLGHLFSGEVADNEKH